MTRGGGADDARERGLLRRDPVLGVPIPAYDGRSIANVVRTVARTVGVERSKGVLPPLAPELDPFGGGSAPGPIVILLVDGLGWRGFSRWAAGSGARGRRWAAAAHPITSVFPTTTAAGLTSLSTGLAPAAHGLVGYRQYLPTYGTVADLLRMSPVLVPGMDLLVGPRWRPALVAGGGTWFRRGLRGAAVSRDRFRGSGFTRVLYDGASYTGYATAVDLAHQLAQLLASRAPPPVVFAYWDELDTIQHLHGPGARALFDLELGRVVDLLRHVARSIGPARGGATTLLVTGDHGQVGARADRQVRVDRLPALRRAMARPLAGDRRAGFFVARSGRTEALRAALSRALPRGARLLDARVAIERGLFGPPPFHPELEERVGDLIALVPEPWGLTWTAPGARPPARYLLGAHGGLAAEELLVPLVAGRLDALAS
ncbi:MAG TPA: alkaline phosphatase family protein [Thermoplasmata archaeon]|nr:alkaline phosphatase family protein [Thermoplasmata archaeon]